MAGTLETFVVFALFGLTDVLVYVHVIHRLLPGLLNALSVIYSFHMWARCGMKARKIAPLRAHAARARLVVVVEKHRTSAVSTSRADAEQLRLRFAADEASAGPIWCCGVGHSEYAPNSNAGARRRAQLAGELRRGRSGRSGGTDAMYKNRQRREIERVNVQELKRKEAEGKEIELIK
ncbi:hypothetical protein B0H13DRAFT_1851222 [Mycena leptocephala]|nr:hypothetical protein B0H13DRAFT_1851222 [Mycena leptocephala]